MHVTQIWRFPIKSVGGHLLAGANITALGIDGDRSFGIVDDETGLVLTGRREPKLLMANATLDPDGPLIVASDRHEMRTSEDLSAWLGRSVTLAPVGTEGGTYEDPLDYEHDEDWQTWQGPGGAWHDSADARVSIASLGSMGGWDPRRFRSNLVVDGEGEDELVGRHIAVGEAVLQVVKPISRCVMVTRPQPGLDPDLDVLRTINRTRGSHLAVGAVIITPGRVIEGDEIRPI